MHEVIKCVAICFICTFSLVIPAKADFFDFSSFFDEFEKGCDPLFSTANVTSASPELFQLRTVIEPGDKALQYPDNVTVKARNDLPNCNVYYEITSNGDSSPTYRASFLLLSTQGNREQFAARMEKLDDSRGDYFEFFVITNLYNHNTADIIYKTKEGRIYAMLNRMAKMLYEKVPMKLEKAKSRIEQVYFDTDNYVLFSELHARLLADQLFGNGMGYSAVVKFVKAN